MYGDLQSRYTYISDTGNSVKNHFLLSDELHACVRHCCELRILDRIESDHQHLEFVIHVAGEMYPIRMYLIMTTMPLLKNMNGMMAIHSCILL